MSEYSTFIRDLPVDQRPRERLAKEGAPALSNTELLAILLRVGSSEESVLHLAEKLLCRFDNLKGLAHATMDDLIQTRGIGPAKAAELLAAIELGIRLGRFTEAPRPSVKSPKEVYQLIGEEMRYLAQEQFRTLCLDTRCGLIRSRTITQGTLNASIVEAREVYREAVACNAASLIAVHNHPSGDPAPSEEDISLTRRLVEAGKIMGIECLDHVVVGDGRFVSLKERGFI